MASSHSESARIQQTITEFFAKSLHRILESRKPRDKWFNIPLRECSEALENLDLGGQSNLEPVVVDVVP